MPNLPPELVHNVISNLAGDTKTLRSCALVDRTWTFLSQSQLLQNTIVFKFSDRSIPAEEQRVAALSRCLSTCLQLRNHVRSIDLGFNFWHQNIKGTDVMAEFLDQLEHVEELNLSILSGAFIPEKLQASISKVLTGTSFRTFNLKTINLPKFPTSNWCFSLSPSLLAIDIDGVRRRSDATGCNEEETMRFSIQSCLMSLKSVCDWLFGLSHSPLQLAILRLRISGSYHTCLDHLLQYASPTLETLQLDSAFDAPMNGEHPLVHIHLSSLPRLRHIVFGRGNVGPLLSAMFTNITTDHGLETVQFKNAITNISHYPFDDIDKLLSQPSLSSLGQVEFDLMTPASHAKAETFLHHMPILKGRGLCQIPHILSE